MGNERSAARADRRELGELLIEVVVAVAIIGSAVVGMVAALGGAFRFAGVSRVDATGDLILVRYAEVLEALPYEPCQPGTTPYSTSAAGAIPTTGLPAGITAGPLGSGDGTSHTFELAVDAVSHWNGAIAPGAFVAGCGASDSGIQALRLRARAGDGTYDRHLTIVKRTA